MSSCLKWEQVWLSTTGQAVMWGGAWVPGSQPRAVEGSYIAAQSPFLLSHWNLPKDTSLSPRVYRPFPIQTLKLTLLLPPQHPRNTFIMCHVEILRLPRAGTWFQLLWILGKYVLTKMKTFPGF